MGEIIRLQFLDESHNRHEDDFNRLFRESCLGIDIMLNEARLFYTVQEAYCIEEGNIIGLKEANDGILASIKNGINKLWNAIVKMVNKFFSRLGELWGGSTKYLEENKDIILRKKPVPDHDIEMWKYNIQNLYNVEFKAQSSKEVMNIKDEKAAETLIIGNILSSIPQKDGEGVKDRINRLVKGDKMEIIKSQNINMTDLYNYCVNFGDFKKTIKEDIKKLESIDKEIQEYVEKIYNHQKEQEESKSQQNNQKSDNTSTESKANGEKKGETVQADVVDNKGNTVGNTNATINKDSVIYSNLLGKFVSVNELTISPNKSTSSSTAGASNPDNVNRNIDDKVDKFKAHDGVSGAKEEGLDIEAIKKSINLYYKIGGDILGAKQTLAVAIFKDYMKIIRWHVNSYTPKEKKSLDKNPDTATKYEKKEEPVEREKLNDE